MGSESWVPDIIVGVDFGMTCTGVAYSTAPDWHEPRVIQNWPGLAGSELHNKVTSALTYSEGTHNVTSWGFLTDVESMDPNMYDLFKLYLDEAYQDKSERPISTSQARACLRDYLRCIRKYTEQTFEESMPHFAEKNIEYTFSTPTTWTSPAMINAIERVLQHAGFADGFNRKIRMGLTEAEAAAVHASKSSHRKGEVIMVCDAGGGTTDVNILKVKDTQRRQVGLNQLICVEGKSIGSALIDFKVKQLVTSRLELVRSHLKKDPSECAGIMMRHRFETFKCSFGATGTNMPAVLLPVPDLEPGQNFPEAHIADSKMQLSRDQVQGIFDNQIDQIFDLIESQLFVLHAEHPGEQISYLVLSGGLGSSPYVKQRLRSRCETELGSRFPSASDMKFLTVQNAQLAVVLGLVDDRVQEMNSGLKVLADRCARNSYGVLCRELYDPAQHMAEEVNKDPRDGKKWAEGQIHWLIKKGQLVSTDRHIEHTYLIKVNPGQEKNPFKTDVVVSDRARDQLPKSLKRPGARILCNLSSTLDPVEMKKKNKHWYSVGPEYQRSEFVVRVLIGAADLKFQVWTKDGKRCSRDHDDIQVKWDPPQMQHVGEDAPVAQGMYKV